MNVNLDNFCMFEGNLTRDPEIRETGNSCVARFSIALNGRQYTTKAGEKKRDVAFVDCEIWDSGAKLIMEYFKKGDPIKVNAEVKNDNWTDKEGQKRSKVVFRVGTFKFVSRGPRKDREVSADDYQTPEQDVAHSDDKNIGF